ncbi:hypothetical protein EVAR_42096_1 [Eumeta japonica]|uniref:Uncharacterized protein n=1 Tax=Eumeta variegata TaxID=151549 RepID=A0A4C1XH79_EUMVA|nr:hypothetical protein EVAR_42096_1 [Eumeta japonica]
MWRSVALVLLSNGYRTDNERGARRVTRGRRGEVEEGVPPVPRLWNQRVHSTDTLLFSYVVRLICRSCSTLSKTASTLSVTGRPEQGSSLTSKLPD